GLDVLIANTGGDRMFDWVGEFNSFIVPFSPFGEPTVNRTHNIHTVQFLRDLGREAGADLTRQGPNGELGLFTPQDPQWQANTGPDNTKVRVVINGVVHGEYDSTILGRIIVYGNAGNDRITISSDLGNVAALVYGGLGNDVITGGEGFNLLDGGEGNDTLTGG